MYYTLKNYYKGSNKYWDLFDHNGGLVANGFPSPFNKTAWDLIPPGSKVVVKHSVPTYSDAVPCPDDCIKVQSIVNWAAKNSYKGIKGDLNPLA